MVTEPALKTERQLQSFLEIFLHYLFRSSWSLAWLPAELPK